MLSKVLFFLLCVLTRLRQFDLFFTPKNYKTLHKMCILRNVTYWLNLTISKISHKKFHEFSIFFAKNFFRFYFSLFLKSTTCAHARTCIYIFYIIFFYFYFFPTLSSLSFHFSPKKHKKEAVLFSPLHRSFCLKNEIKKYFSAIRL